jgi:dTDP-4-amino-4,6-dideoxygalactose transaminase
MRGMASAAGAVLVEDAPHALGSVGTFGGVEHPVGDGAYSAFASFSFHPVKTLATGEGGMLTTNDAGLAARARSLRGHGMVRPPGSDPWWYEMPEIGFNYRIPDVLCALGISQLAKLDRFVARRRALTARYVERLEALSPRVRLATSPDYSNPALHLLTVLIDFDALEISRRMAVDGLKAHGIGSQVHYIPVHQQPYYVKRYGTLDLPGAQAWYDRCLTLPLYPTMADGDVDRVVDALAKVLAR